MLSQKTNKQQQQQKRHQKPNPGISSKKAVLLFPKQNTRSQQLNCSEPG
jgi:hypothetical protein